MATEMGRTTRRTTFCFVIWRLLFRELVGRGCVVLFRASPPSLSRSKAVPKFPLNSRSRMISFSWKLARYFRLSLFALGPTLLLRPASSTDFYIFCCRFFCCCCCFFWRLLLFLSLQRHNFVSSASLFKWPITPPVGISFHFGHTDRTKPGKTRYIRPTDRCHRRRSVFLELRSSILLHATLSPSLIPSVRSCPPEKVFFIHRMKLGFQRRD